MTDAARAALRTWAEANAPVGNLQARQVLELLADLDSRDAAIAGRTQYELIVDYFVKNGNEPVRSKTLCMALGIKRKSLYQVIYCTHKKSFARALRVYWKLADDVVANAMRKDGAK